MPEFGSPATGVAVVTMELQRGVVGDHAAMPAIAQAASERGTLQACGRLVDGARRAGVPVVHACVRWRRDRVGTTLVTPLLSGLARREHHMAEGSDAIELVAELSDTSADVVSWRRHGLGPWHGTDLEPLLRSMGVTTVVAVGVSVNVGITGLCLGATDRGFRCTVPVDAVVGVPVTFGDDVLEHSIAAMAELVTVDDLLDDWSRARR